MVTSAVDFSSEQPSKSTTTVYMPELSVVAEVATTAFAVDAEYESGPVHVYVAPVAFWAVQETESGFPAQTFPLVSAVVMVG